MACAGAETLVPVSVAGTDLLTLDLHAQLLLRLGGEDAAGAEDAATLEGEEEVEASGPLQLAIDVDEPPAEAAAATA